MAAFESEIDDKMRANKGNGLASLWNRAWEHAAKVALVHAASRMPENPLIDVEDVTFGVGVVAYNITVLSDLVNAHVGDNPHHALVKKLLRIVREPTKYMDKQFADILKQGIMPATKALKMMKISKFEFDAVVATAQASGLIDVGPLGKDGKGPRVFRIADGVAKA